jgi:hypothetical protein
MESLSKVTEEFVKMNGEAIVGEFFRARKKFAPMRGAHEGYAVLLEEVDEMWDAVKKNDIEHAKREALQVAAMALAFILEV